MPHIRGFGLAEDLQPILALYVSYMGRKLVHHVKNTGVAAGACAIDRVVEKYAALEMLLSALTVSARKEIMLLTGCGDEEVESA